MKLKNLTTYIISAILAFAVLYIAVGNLYSGQKNTKTNFALNTYTTITAYGKDSKRASENAASVVADVEARFSAYIDSSEISHINAVQAKDTPIHISDELFYIIKTALDYSHISGGLFDITLKPVSDLWSISQNPRLPSQSEIDKALEHTGYENIILNEQDKTITFLKDGMQLDLGAIAKGYGADLASEEILKNGTKKAIIDLGGNICLIGTNKTPLGAFLDKCFKTDNKKPWRIGIQTPFAPSGTSCAVISVENEDSSKTSVVTSGAYERNFTENGVLYHHILNPKTGYPYNGEIESVTIIGESSMHADALSTTSFMMDIDDALTLVKKQGYDALIIDKDKKIHTTLDKSSVEIVDSLYSFAD
ncbi:MAG: FAD:protein FMN transferase [Ruminococcaceae bacterium]|nr:FAD:protein FMN transferase [Oscillospiraceae bacterium]